MSTSDPIEMARGNLRLALGPFFKGSVMKNKLEDAVSAALNAVQPQISLDPTLKHSLGATVMTESAATKNNIRPKNL
jgi:hypothetical protein